MLRYCCRVDNAASNALARSCGFTLVRKVQVFFRKEGREFPENCYEMAL